MFSCLPILEAFLWFVLITLLNVTLLILTLSVSRLLNLLLRLRAILLFPHPHCLASASRLILTLGTLQRSAGRGVGGVLDQLRIAEEDRRASVAAHGLRQHRRAVPERQRQGHDGLARVSRGSDQARRPLERNQGRAVTAG